MTIILAGLFDEGNGAVIVGDKLRTASHPLVKEEVLVEREDITKIYNLNDNVTVATSGEMEFWSDILKDMHDAIKNSDSFNAIRSKTEIIYRRHFSRYQWSRMPGFFGFSDMDDYLKRGPSLLSAAQIDNLNQRFMSTVASGEMVLVGKGQLGYEIYTLSDPGIFKYSNSSISIAGSGTPHAFKYVNEKYVPSMTKDEVIELLMHGKKLAEADIHVGTMTNVVTLPS